MTSPTQLTVFKIPSATRERIRKAIRALEDAGTKLTLRAVTEEAKVDRRSANLLVRLYRDGVLSRDAGWDGSLTPELVSQRIDEATTDTLRAQLCNDLAKAMHQGQIEPGIGRAMATLIAEARHCDRAARESAQVETEAKPIYLLSHEGIVVGRALDFLVSDELRAEAIAFMEDLARRDLELFPNPTTAEIEALRAEGASNDQ